MVQKHDVTVVSTIPHCDFQEGQEMWVAETDPQLIAGKQETRTYDSKELRLKLKTS